MNTGSKEKGLTNKAPVVLVTRPAAQSSDFIRQLTRAGLTPLSLPTIEIQFVTDAKQALADALQNDLIIFTSANSVTGAHNIIPMPWHYAGKIAAIGKKTAAKLENLKVTVDLQPMQGASSEDLLAAVLAVIGDVRQKTISIVRGDSGREFLHDALRNRGATVQYCRVYNRSIPRYSAADLEQCFSSGLPDIISITSDLGLANLLEIIPQELKPALLQMPLVVNSQRCEQLARQSGFSADVLIANPPGDEGQVPEISRLAHELLTQR